MVCHYTASQSETVLTCHNGIAGVLQAGARAIHTAALTGHAGVINALIQKGENVDVATRVRPCALWSLSCAYLSLSAHDDLLLILRRLVGSQRRNNLIVCRRLFLIIFCFVSPPK